MWKGGEMKDVLEFCTEQVSKNLDERPREIALMVRAGVESAKSGFSYVAKNLFVESDENGWPLWKVKKAVSTAVKEKKEAEHTDRETAQSFEEFYDEKAAVTGLRYSAYLLQALKISGFEKEAQLCADSLIRALNITLEKGFFHHPKSPKWFVVDTVVSLIEYGFVQDESVLNNALKWTMDTTFVEQEKRYLIREDDTLRPKPEVDSTAILCVAATLTSPNQYETEINQMKNYLLYNYQNNLPYEKKIEPYLRSVCRIAWAFSFLPEGWRENNFQDLYDNFCKNWKDWHLQPMPEQKNLRIYSLCECAYLLTTAKNNLANK